MKTEPTFEGQRLEKLRPSGRRVVTPIDRLTQFIDEDRIIRRMWHNIDKNGRETACLLGAMGKEVDAPEKCPADVMPAWLAHLTPRLNDEGSIAEWPAMVRRYGAAARQWHVLDEGAWRRCLAKTMLAALAIAAPYDKGNSAATVIALWTRVLNSDEPSSLEWQAAQEAADEAGARATAWEATAWEEAAWAAAWGEAWAVAWVTAWEVEVVEREGAVVAGEAAWDQIADACLSAIEAEIAKTTSRIMR